jgi:hypothetical protein
VDNDDLIEKLAAYAHDAWAGWMRYQFEKSTPGWGDQSGTYTIPRGLVERWNRQMNTPYAGLPPDEKESDRDEARKILAIIGKVG